MPLERRSVVAPVPMGVPLCGVRQRRILVALRPTHLASSLEPRIQPALELRSIDSPFLVLVEGLQQLGQAPAKGQRGLVLYARQIEPGHPALQNGALLVRWPRVEPVQLADTGGSLVRMHAHSLRKSHALPGRSKSSIAADGP